MVSIGKRHKTTPMQIVVRSQPDRKSSVRKHSGSFDEDKEAEYDFSACQHRARVVKRTSTGPSQVPKHGIGFAKKQAG